ncbi:Aristolochene synthase in complex with 12,13-Difluorofarnesyl diphosphate [Xylaria digitata]|nr:Aristolochene synthase in complex with 12,13-Difluorofarnesyl diphosphate [Xylaria digitata]
MEFASSSFPLLCHPRFDTVEQETNEFTQCTCMYFPTARDDRIHFACRLLSILFLIDDVLEEMSFDEGKAYNGKLMALVRGDELPDRSIPVQSMFYELWEAMRSNDEELAEGIVEPLFIFMRSQIDNRRAQPMSLMQYLELLCALMRFCLNIKLTTGELALVQPADVNCGRHIAVINDIWSFEKEKLAAKRNEEGSVLCNSVAILSTEAGLSTASSKRVLHCMCREWENNHRQLLEELLSGHENVVLQGYFQGLGYQMSGNVAWSQLTRRYQMQG